MMCNLRPMKLLMKLPNPLLSEIWWNYIHRQHPFSWEKPVVFFTGKLFNSAQNIKTIPLIRQRLRRNATEFKTDFAWNIWIVTGPRIPWGWRGLAFTNRKVIATGSPVTGWCISMDFWRGLSFSGQVAINFSNPLDESMTLQLIIKHQLKRSYGQYHRNCYIEKVIFLVKYGIWLTVNKHVWTCNAAAPL